MLILLGFLGGSARKETICNAGDPGSIPGLGRFCWRRAGESHEQRSLEGYSPMGYTDLDTTEAT